MSDSLYSVRFSGPSMIEQGKDQDVIVNLEKDGDAVHPSSATFTVYRPEGTKIVDDISATVMGGKITGSIAAAETTGENLGRNWLVQFDAVISGSTYRFYNDAVLCLARLYPPIGQTDLIARHSDVVALVSTAKADLQDYIDTAWSDITNRLYSDSVPFWKFRTPSALRGVMFARCFELIFRDYSTLFDAGDRYADLADRYAETYSTEFDQMRNRIDANEDNTIDTDAVPSTATILLSSGPRSRWR